MSEQAQLGVLENTCAYIVCVDDKLPESAYVRGSILLTASFLVTRATSIKSFLKNARSSDPLLSSILLPSQQSHQLPWMWVSSGQELKGLWMPWKLWHFHVLSLPLYDLRWSLGCTHHVTWATPESSCCPRLYKHSGECIQVPSPTRVWKPGDLHNLADQCLLHPLWLQEFSHVWISWQMRTGSQLLHYSEWNWLQRNEWRIKDMTLDTYCSVKETW